MKITIYHLTDTKQINAAIETCEDFAKVHGNILSVSEGEGFLLLDLPDAFHDYKGNDPEKNAVIMGISEYQLKLIFNAGQLFQSNQNIQDILHPLKPVL